MRAVRWLRSSLVWWSATAWRRPPTRRGELTIPAVAAALERALTRSHPGSAVAAQVEKQQGARDDALEVLELALGLARSDTLEEAMAVVVSLPGDGRSLGSICGALIGARDGLAALPVRWRAWLDGRSVVEEVADDCVTWLRWLEGAQEGGELGAAWLARYG